MRKVFKKTKSKAFTTLTKKVNRISKVIGDNVKTVQVSYAATPLNATAAFQQFTPLAQGAGATQRIGNEISVKKLILSSITTPNTTAQSEFMRQIVFKWSGDVSTNPPISADILFAPGTLSSGYNYTNKKMYKILMDKTYTVITGQQIHHFKKTIRVSPRDTKCSFVGTGATDLGVGQFYSLVLTTAPANAPTAIVTLIAEYSD